MKSDQACQVAQGRWYRSGDVICIQLTTCKDEEVNPWCSVRATAMSLLGSKVAVLLTDTEGA